MPQMPAAHATDASVRQMPAVHAIDASAAQPASRDLSAPGADAAAQQPALDAATPASATHGGTITFQAIGAAGWFPSRRDPASSDCSAYRTDSCCMTRHEISSDALTPWDEDLIMTLRGPIVARQIAVYQPVTASSEDWTRVAAWSARSAQSAGFAFEGDATKGAAFTGTVGDQCLLDVASDQVFPCGPGSVPYCPATPPAEPKHYGFSGSKLVVLLLSMPHDGDGTIAAAQDCSDDVANNWHDAPWIGFSHGELVRSGKFGDCHCYAKDPAKWSLGDGCGQFNAFEVVNDNGEAKNLDVFSTNFFGYQGYIGEGPCGSRCNTRALASEVDLIDKTTSAEAARGAIATPDGGPGAAFRRPSTGPRYFIILFDVDTRSVQLALISPELIPAEAAPVLPDLPEHVAVATVDALLGLRLPH
jgi:hypothetical protein